MVDLTPKAMADTAVPASRSPAPGAAAVADPDQPGSETPSKIWSHLLGEDEWDTRFTSNRTSEDCPTTLSATTRVPEPALGASAVDRQRQDERAPSIR